MLRVQIRAFGQRARQWYAACQERGAAFALRAAAGVRAARRKVGVLAEAGARAIAAVRSERLRERLMAMGAFAGLALVMAASCDYLLSGGPDWNPSAEAAPYRAEAYLTLTALPEIPYAPPAELAAAPEEDLEQATVTRVSYTAPAGVLLGGPLPGDELDAPAVIVYAHEGPAPFGEYEAPAEPNRPGVPF